MSDPDVTFSDDIPAVIQPPCDPRPFNYIERPTLMFCLAVRDPSHGRLDDYAFKQGGVSEQPLSHDLLTIICCSMFANIFGIVDSWAQGTPLIMPEGHVLWDMAGKLERGEPVDIMGGPKVLWDIEDINYFEESDELEIQIKRIRVFS